MGEVPRPEYGHREQFLSPLCLFSRVIEDFLLKLLNGAEG